jgi:uncharacterized repeat protein (TIGR01451 family)
MGLVLTFGADQTRCGSQAPRLRRGLWASERKLGLTLGVFLALLSLAVVWAGIASGGAVVSSAGCGTSVLPANDDGSTGRVNLPFTVNFFGTSYSSLFVNNNGNVTFDSFLSTYTPFPLTSTNRVMIAPFFADVDTRGQGSGLVTYGATTFAGRPAFCVEWPHVGYYSGGTDKLNTFELLLVDRSDIGVGDFDIVINYDQVQWESGSASGGTGGLGGSPARAGYSNGSNTSFEFAGSGVSGAFLDSSPQGLTKGSRNSVVEGRYVFPVRNGVAPVGGSISGHVFGSGALAGALVAACNGSSCTTATTDSGGAYSIGGLPAGTYSVRAFGPADSHLPKTISVTLEQGQSSTGNDLTLDTLSGTPTPPISGSVISSNEGPIAGATVTLLRSESGAEGTFAPVPQGSALFSPVNRTNPDTSRANGSFGWDVFPGFYMVRAEKQGCGGSQSPVVNVTNDSFLNGGQLVLDCPDLDVSKTANANSVTVGDNITYTIVVTNVGHETAIDPVITDTLPAGVTLVSATSEKASCEDTSGGLICPITSDELAPGESATVTVVVKTTEVGQPRNVVTVSSDSEDPTSANNSAEATVTVNAQAPPEEEPPPTGPNTINLVSDTSWQVFAVDPATPGATPLGFAQYVCLNANAPPNCPPGATLYGYPFSGWAIDLSRIPGAARIWAPGITGTTSPAALAQYYFVHNVDLPGAPTAGTFSLAADDFAELRVNGTVVGSRGSTTDAGLAGQASGSLGDAFDIRPFLTAGANTIVVRAQNGTFGGCCTYAQNPAGVVFGGSITAEVAEPPPALPDLVVTKSDSADPVQAGGTLTYTITVANQGDAPAADVHLAEQLPAGVTLQTINPSQGFCEVDCALGTIDAGASAIVTVTVIPTESGQLSNTATATTETEQTTIVNDSDTETTVVEQAPQATGPDLSVSKTANANSVTVGDNITYTIVVTDAGDGSATGVVITDNLPAGVSFVSVTPDSCGHAEGVVTCEPDTLDPDPFTVTIVVKTTATGEPRNVATVTSDQTDANLEDNTDDATVTVNPEQPPPTTTTPEEQPPPTSDATADLSLSKTATSFVTKGQGFAYTIAVKNNGPDPASGVTLTDSLPAGVSFNSASPSQGSCSGTVTCSLGTINSGSSATVTINVTADTPGFVTNIARVSAAQIDANPGNNSAEATTRISPRIDLGVSGSVSPNGVPVGGQLTYRLIVTNNGPDLAEGALLQVAIPGTATFVSVTPSQGLCIRDGTVVCFLGRIAAGGSATVDLVLRTTVSGELVLSPAVSSDGGTDSNSANNATSVSGVAAEPYDLRITVNTTPAKVKTGEWMTIHINAGNLGPGTATDVIVVNQLPENVAFVSCETTQGECTSAAFLRAAASRRVEARLGRLGSGDSGNVKIVGRATGPGTATNSAAVSGSGEDPALSGNNEATTETPVAANPNPPPAQAQQPPVFGETVVAATKDGTIEVRVPPSNVFEPLQPGQELPLGAEIKATDGTVTLTSATNTAGTVQTADFWDSYFIVTQTVIKKTTAVTNLTLTRGDFATCKGGRKLSSVEKKPPKGKKPKGKKQKGKKNTTVRQLWGRGDGKFRTKGRYSAATIRGTHWLTADRCDGTLTRVREGSVTVRDFVRKRTIIVRAGQSYVARPKR